MNPFRRSKPDGLRVYLDVLPGGIPYVQLDHKASDAEKERAAMWFEAVQKSAEITALQRYAAMQNASA